MKELFEVLNRKLEEKDKDKIKKSVDDILENAMCFVAVNNNGVLVEGDRVSILSCVSALVSSLTKEARITKEEIYEAVELGLKSKEELRTQSKEKLMEMLTELLEK